MSGQIDRIGDDGGGGVGLRRRPRQNGDGVGDAERKTAAVASAGGDAARRIVGLDQLWFASGRADPADPPAPR